MTPLRQKGDPWATGVPAAASVLVPPRSGRPQFLLWYINGLYSLPALMRAGVGAWLGPPLEITGVQNSGNNRIQALQAIATAAVVLFARSPDFWVREIYGFLGSRDPQIARGGGRREAVIEDRTRQWCTSVSSR
jgi:hypothetical protein